MSFDFAVDVCPKYEDGNLYDMILAEIQFCKIDPWHIQNGAHASGQKLEESSQFKLYNQGVAPREHFPRDQSLPLVTSSPLGAIYIPKMNSCSQ
jgi:hypothetical protein